LQFAEVGERDAAELGGMTYAAVQMKTARLELRITEELLAQIDVARGDVSRTRWVERALEKALGAEDRVPERAVPAPSRAPVPGVKRASSVLSERQAKLNASRKK
jgi:hypothetical protein